MIWAVFAAHLACRLAYVAYVWIGLARQQTDGWWTRACGIEGGFQRFRRGASLTMVFDAVSFIAVCLVSRGTLAAPGPRALVIAIGVVLALVGIGTKLWAAATLGDRAYYWYNFFTPAEPVVAVTTGPYRYLRNPMYTVGYLQTYGLSLITGSFAGLIASVCDQVAILVFHWRVERRHFVRVTTHAP